MGSGGNAATLFATADLGRQMGYRGSSLRLAGCQVVALQTEGETTVRMRRPQHHRGRVPDAPSHVGPAEA